MQSSIVSVLELSLEALKKRKITLRLNSKMSDKFYAKVYCAVLAEKLWKARKRKYIVNYCYRCRCYYTNDRDVGVFNGPEHITNIVGLTQRKEIYLHCYTQYKKLICGISKILPGLNEDHSYMYDFLELKRAGDVRKIISPQIEFLQMKLLSANSI